MTVSTPLEFISATINLLRTTLGPHCHSFMVKEGKELAGRLNHTAFGAPWLKYLLGDIYSLLATALRVNNSHLICTSKRFRDALRIIRQTPPSKKGDTQRALHTGVTARSTHGCNPLLRGLDVPICPNLTRANSVS
jgi:hypothetical protein